MKGFLRSKHILSLVTVVIIATALLIALAGNAIHSWAAATDLYVNATTGNDSNSGSQSAPFATINKAASVAQPGTTVHVAPGNYNQPVTTNPSGTATARITYISDVQWGARIDIAGKNAENAWTNYGDYVDINGFEIMGGTHEGILDYSTQYSRFIGNKVHDISTDACRDGAAGINPGNGDYTQHDLEVSGNIIYHIGPSSYCSIAQGIYVSGLRDRVVNNIVYANSGNGIQCWHACNSPTIINNLVFNNQASGIIAGDGDSPGYGSTKMNNADISNNIAVNNGEYGIREYEYPGQHTLGPNNQFLNDLVYDNSSDGFYLLEGNTDSNPVTADPQFINYKPAGGGDYDLKSTSPAIDAGTSIGAPATDIDGNPRPQGKGYDIGPCEYGSSSPTPTPTPTSTAPTPTPQPGGESIALRAAASANNGTGGSTLTIDLPAGTQRGDVLVALVVVRTAGNVITPPEGWNLVLRQDSSSSISTASYVHVAGSSEPASYSWSFETAGQASGGIASYIGVDSSTPVDASHAQYNRSSSNVDNSGVTTTTANDMLVYAVGITTATTVNVPAGFSQQWQTTSSSSTTSEMSQQTYSSIGATGTIHGTQNGGSRSNITHLIALKPAEVAITATPTPTPPPTPTPTPIRSTPTPQPGGGSIALRAAASSNNDTGGSTLTIDLPAGTQRGDVLVALVVVRTAGNTITAPAGWKLVLRQDSAASISTASYVKVAGSSEPASYTWSFGTAGQASGGIASYIGVDTTTPVDAAHAQYNRLSSNVNNSGVTTTTANDMLVYAVGITTATTVNVPAGFSQQWQTTSSSSTTSEMSQQTYSSIGATGTIHGTHNGGDSSNITHLIALKPAGVAAAVTPALIASTQKPLPVADSLPLTASIKQCCSPRPHPV
jgi:Protein of unknown function (DUF1565)